MSPPIPPRPPREKFKTACQALLGERWSPAEAEELGKLVAEGAALARVEDYAERPGSTPPTRLSVRRRLFGQPLVVLQVGAVFGNDRHPPRPGHQPRRRVMVWRDATPEDLTISVAPLSDLNSIGSPPRVGSCLSKGPRTR
ncbi:hypothetical protein [Sphingomonas pituitosa]|uniref:hypothetical protein n=1 Tax=Sphingomonas pituitosa TaxID=99597 RepID=UPI0012EDEA14|nr:hypothetical protein [Sphingomonas pituitosa]